MNCENCGHSVAFQFFAKSRSKADRIFISSGNHELLQKANQLVELAKEYEKEVKRLQRKNRNRLKAEWHHEVEVLTNDGAWIELKVPEGEEMVQITARLVNPQVFEQHLKLYGSLLQPPDEKRISVKYYRKHGILFRSGGGYGILEDEQPCSDEEWEAIKDGNIPDKFLKGA